MSAANRTMLESTLYNLRRGADPAGVGPDVREEIAALSDDDLEKVLTEFLTIV